MCIVLAHIAFRFALANFPTKTNTIRCVCLILGNVHFYEWIIRKFCKWDIWKISKRQFHLMCFVQRHQLLFPVFCLMTSFAPKIVLNFHSQLICTNATLFANAHHNTSDCLKPSAQFTHTHTHIYIARGVESSPVPVFTLLVNYRVCCWQNDASSDWRMQGKYTPPPLPPVVAI